MTTPIVQSITDEQLAEIERDAIARGKLKKGQCEGGKQITKTYFCNHCGAGPQDGCRQPLPQRYASAPTILSLIARLRAAEADVRRLDKLDALCEAYGFEGIHEGNRWMIEGPYRNVRVAIDDIKPDSVVKP